MSPEFLDWLPPGELTLTCLATLVALAAVWIPFRRGMGIFLKARAATRPVDDVEIREHLRRGSRDGKESIGLLLADVLDQSFRENASGAHPTEFIRDASRQYAMNEYDVTYAQPISMYANLLPPIGFIGTTVGLMILFLSMRAANDSLEIGALAIALTSTIFALLGFAALEALKIKLYRRLLRCLDDALGCEIAPVGPPRPAHRAQVRSDTEADPIPALSSS
jgi:hypothetical protein